MDLKHGWRAVAVVGATGLALVACGSDGSSSSEGGIDDAPVETTVSSTTSTTTVESTSTTVDQAAVDAYLAGLSGRDGEGTPASGGAPPSAGGGGSISGGGANDSGETPSGSGDGGGTSFQPAPFKPDPRFQFVAPTIVLDGRCVENGDLLGWEYYVRASGGSRWNNVASPGSVVLVYQGGSEDYSGSTAPTISFTKQGPTSWVITDDTRGGAEVTVPLSGPTSFTCTWVAE